MTAHLKDRLVARATSLGFDAVGVCDAELPDAAGADLMAYVGQGHHGTMAWMAETATRRVSPTAMWPEARSAIVLAMNYGPAVDPMARLDEHRAGIISVYALNRDYHDVIKGRLKTVAQWLAARTGARVKVFVDTAPLMEKPLAQAAGIGWQGKHTNLVSRDKGSWLFLGVILTDAPLAANEPETDHCGTCRKCLDICPTAAFPAPYRIDARRCISYLTIEHKGHIAREFRDKMGNRIFGCDDCLAVCPWNKYAAMASEAKLRARTELVSPPLADLARLDDQGFRKLFAGSPVKRIGRDRLVRNVLIAIGNSGDAGLADAAEARLADASPLVRAMAVWALSRLLPTEAFGELRARHLTAEPDGDVRGEWQSA